jgi:hypothetical protein
MEQYDINKAKGEESLNLNRTYEQLLCLYNMGQPFRTCIKNQLCHSERSEESNKINRSETLHFVQGDIFESFGADL